MKLFHKLTSRMIPQTATIANSDSTSFTRIAGITILVILNTLMHSKNKPSFAQRSATWGAISLHGLVAILAIAGPAWILAGSFFPDGTFTLEVWKSVAGDLGRWFILLATTAKVVCMASIFSLPPAFVVATLLFKTNIRLRTLCLGLLLFAACIPLYVTSGSILSWFDRNAWLESTTLVSLIHAIAFFPVAVLLIGSSLRTVPAQHEENAQLDGAGTIRTLTCITPRLGISGIIAALALLILLVSTDYSVADLLTVRTFAEEVYTQTALHARPYEPALVAIPQLFIIAALLWSLRRWYVSDTETPDWEKRTKRFHTGPLRIPLSIATVALCLTIPLFPIVSVAKGLIKPESITRYIEMFRPELEYTFLSSIAAALAASILAVGFAWLAVRHRRWRIALGAWVVCLLAVPGPVFALGIIVILNHHGLPGRIYDSPAVLALAWLLRFLPVAVLLLIPAIRAVPRDCEEAARLDGCGTTGLWIRIVWPLSLAGAGITFFLLIILMISELPCSILVKPAGYSTVGVRFFNLVHYGMYNDAIVLCLLSIAMIFIPFSALALILRKKI